MKGRHCARLGTCHLNDKQVCFICSRSVVKYGITSESYFDYDVFPGEDGGGTLQVLENLLHFFRVEMQQKVMSRN